MSDSYDVIVLGVGGMGSATCFHLAQRGLRVLGLEQFSLVNDRGSSHGQTRIIRQAYFEHPDYVPLLFRAYELWDELEQATRHRLFYKVGLILSGLPEGETIRGARLSAELHHLIVEELSPDEAHQLWPVLTFPQDHAVVFEPAAGLLLVEDCVEAHGAQAMHAGADIRPETAVLSWKSDGKSVVVQTDKGEFSAASLVITAGPWAGQCLSGLGLSLNVVRKYVGWFPILDGDFRVDSGMPTFFYELPHGTFYGFPSMEGRSVKVAEHSGGQAVLDPLTVDRAQHPEDYARLSEFLKKQIPGISPRPSQHSVCLYTASEDHHFIVDHHPEWSNVVFATGFSGHGFKFAPVIGESLADLVEAGSTELPIEFLSLKRFVR